MVHNLKNYFFYSLNFVLDVLIYVNKQVHHNLMMVQNFICIFWKIFYFQLMI